MESVCFWWSTCLRNSSFVWPLCSQEERKVFVWYSIIISDYECNIFKSAERVKVVSVIKRHLNSFLSLDRISMRF